jgi:hypothetical protein
MHVVRLIQVLLINNGRRAQHGVHIFIYEVLRIHIAASGGRMVTDTDTVSTERYYVTGVGLHVCTDRVVYLTFPGIARGRPTKFAKGNL